LLVSPVLAAGLSSMSAAAGHADSSSRRQKLLQTTELADAGNLLLRARSERQRRHTVNQ
jgi:hypothetical protein